MGGAARGGAPRMQFPMDPTSFAGGLTPLSSRTEIATKPFGSGPLARTRVQPATSGIGGGHVRGSSTYVPLDPRRHSSALHACTRADQETYTHAHTHTHTHTHTHPHTDANNARAKHMSTCTERVLAGVTLSRLPKQTRQNTRGRGKRSTTIYVKPAISTTIS